MLHGHSLRSQSEEPASLSIGLRTYNTLYQLMHVAIANVRSANLCRYIYEYTLCRIVQHPWDAAVRDNQAGTAEGRLDSFSPCVEQDLMQRATALRATS